MKEFSLCARITHSNLESRVFDVTLRTDDKIKVSVTTNHHTILTGSSDCPAVPSRFSYVHGYPPQFTLAEKMELAARHFIGTLETTLYSRPC